MPANIEVKICFWEDILSVLNRLSEVNEAEYAKIGWDRKERENRLIAFMALADTKVMWFDGQPQAVLAVRKSSLGPTTWFVATQYFFENFNKSVVKACRQYMASMARKHGSIVTVSVSDHPMAEKWFLTCGYKLADVNGPAKIFLYTPR